MQNDIYLQLKDIRKRFDSVDVLSGISLDIFKGECLSVLGSSGSGKTTLIRIVAGLEEPDGGAIILENTDITALPPEKRHINMVFQNYALFEHMTVEENIGYSLKFLDMTKQERRTEVQKTMAFVDLSGMEKRMPSQLSGGQRQRVAIARAIINKPKILLLDEPLSALDRNLRIRMKEELKTLQQKLGITCIYITHDIEEAAFMGSRIALLGRGKIASLDTVDNTLKSNIPFVREFLGEKK